MANDEFVGTVSGLYRFPVKSMGGEKIDTAELTNGGILGDRTYALIETDTGKVVSAKSVRRFPNLLSCKAAFVTAPSKAGEIPPKNEKWNQTGAAKKLRTTSSK